MLKRFIAALMLVLLLVPCQLSLADGLTAIPRWTSKPSNEDLQELARMLGKDAIGGTAEIIHSGNFRESASEYSLKVGVAIPGEVYEITDYYLNGNGRSWIEIDWDGYEVWVSASLVQVDASNALDARQVNAYTLIGTSITINARSARARSGAGTEYYTVGYVYGKERYVVLDTDVSDAHKIWYQIRVDGRLGWISSGIAKNDSVYVSTPYISGGSSSSSSGSSSSSRAPSSGSYKPYPVGQTCAIIAQSANARSAAGTSYPVVAYVQRNERYEILDVDTAANGKQWYQIRVDGVYCWISSGVAEVR